MRQNLFPQNFTQNIVIFIFTILSLNLAIGQSRDAVVSKIKEIKSQPNFNEENTVYIDLLMDLSRTYLFKNSDSLLINLDKAYELSVKTNYKNGETRALHNYGYFYAQEGESKKAYEFNTKSLELANKYDIKRQKIFALNNLALDYWAKGETSIALTHFLQSLAVAEAVDDLYMISTVNDNIGILYSDNLDYETALTFHDKSREISLQTGNEDALASTLLNMAVIYVEQKKYDLATIEVDKCINIFEKNNIVDWMSHSYEVKGSIAIELENFDEALKWYKKSEKICDEISYDPGYTRTYAGIAKAYFGLKKFKEAEYYGLKALEISSKLEILETIKYSNKTLSEIYHAKGEEKLAFKYQTEYLKLFEKTSEENFKNGLGILRSKMNFENQKKELIEDNDRALAKQRLYVYVALFVLTILCVFLGFMYKLNKKQKRLNEVLIVRESELKASNKTKDKLFSVIAHDLKGPINSFYSLMKLYLDDGFSKEESQFIFPKALQEINGISEMLNNLLIWGKTQMQGTLLNQKEVELYDLSQKTISFLSPLALKKAIKIENNIPEDTFVFGDQDHIDIILRNLISNAIKFTNQNGEIKVNVTDQISELQIEVKDDGVGMDIKTAQSLFNNEANSSTFGTNNEKGTGLGLSLCKELVESNGGKIWIDSIKDVGTSIYFTIQKSSIKRLAS